MSSEMTYVGYHLKMSPHGIQFFDNEAKITLKTLARHDFEQGDTFTLHEDASGKVCLKKDIDKCRMPSS